MKDLETIDAWQMATLFLSFLIGSAIINLPAPLTGAALNGAWLSIVIANAAGFIILYCILYLYRKYPDLTYIDYGRKILGKWVSGILFIPFLILLLMLVSYIVIDIGGFMTSTMMKATPLYIFHALILFTAALTVRAGIEVMARMFLVLLYAMFMFGLAVVLLAIPIYKPEHLFPMMPYGIKPILHGAYLAFGFPYVEITLFAMILPFCKANSHKKLGKYMYFALLLSGIGLISAVIFTILAMGPLSGNLKYSIYQLARLVSIGDIIERIESVIGMSLIAGSYMKVTITLFALNMGVSQFLKLRDDRILIFPLALISFLLTMTMYESEAAFVHAVSDVWPLMFTVIGLFPLLLITFVSFLRKTN